MNASSAQHCCVHCCVLSAYKAVCFVSASCSLPMQAVNHCLPILMGLNQTGHAPETHNSTQSTGVRCGGPAPQSLPGFSSPLAVHSIPSTSASWKHLQKQLDFVSRATPWTWQLHQHEDAE
eukprot:992950-Pelagomonas_calceolata.AAC.1